MRISGRNKDGFSIVMVLVGTALLGLLALCFSEMIGGAMKGQKNVQNAVDFDILKTSINMVLNTKACDGAFKNAAGNNVELNFPGTMPLGTNIIVAASPFPIAKILQGNSLIAEQGASLGGGMKISKLELVDAIYDGDQAIGSPAVTYKAFVATLNVEATKASGSYGNQSPRATFSMRLLLRPNAGNTAGAVEKCGPSDGVGSCPTEMTLVSGSGATSFCIDKNRTIQNSGQSHTSAMHRCIIAGKRLCYSYEWVAACQSGNIPGMLGTLEWALDWFQDSGGILAAAYVVGANPTCASGGEQRLNGTPSVSFRCCKR